MTTAFQPNAFQSDGFQIDGGVATGAAITGTLNYANNNDAFSGVAVLTVGVDPAVLGGNIKFKPVKVPVEAKAPAPLTYDVTNLPDAVPPKLGRGLTLGLLPEAEPTEIAAPTVKVPEVVAKAKVATPPPPAPEPPAEPLPEPTVAAAPPPAPPSIEARVEDLAAALDKATKQLEALQARVAAQVELAQTTAAELAADEAARMKREQNRRRAEALTRKLMAGLTS